MTRACDVERPHRKNFAGFFNMLNPNLQSELLSDHFRHTRYLKILEDEGSVNYCRKVFHTRLINLC